eukprot:scaffold1436_cov250-Pinguiococcus_pyrenoidosus.AAC.14
MSLPGPAAYGQQGIGKNRRNGGEISAKFQKGLWDSQQIANLLLCFNDLRGNLGLLRFEAGRGASPRHAWAPPGRHA